MKTNKVLITTYHSAFLQPGGGESELQELAGYLKHFSVDVDIYGPASQPLASYDTVIHFSVHGGGFALLGQIKSCGKKIILWTNLWWAHTPSDEEINSVKRFFDLADWIFFKSKAELDNVMQYLNVPSEKAVTITWGVDPRCGELADPNLFRDLYGLSDYILWTGVIEPRRNQLSAIRALKDIGIPLVFIGQVNDPVYFQQCLDEAPEHCIFIPHMPPASDVLRSAVQNCTLFLEVSLEPPGLSALEAGLAGRRLVLSDNPWTSEEFGDMVSAVNPLDQAQIRYAVQEILEKNETGPDHALASRIRQKHLLPGALGKLVRVINDEH